MEEGKAHYFFFMAKAFEVLDHFMEYGEYKIRNVENRLEPLGSIQYPEMAGNRVTSEKMRHGNLEVHSLISDVESEVFIKHEASQSYFYFTCRF